MFNLDPYGRWYFGAGEDFDLQGFEFEDREAFVAVIANFLGDFEIEPRAEDPPGDLIRLVENDVTKLISFNLFSDLEMFNSVGNSTFRSANKSEDDTGPTIFERMDSSLAVPLPLRLASVVKKQEEMAEPSFDPPDGKRTQEPTVTIVIDDGINFGHPRFRIGSDDESRVDFAWVMDADAQPGSTVRFGREWTRGEIEAEISKAGDDPEALLRHLGLQDFSVGDFHSAALFASHGTCIADLAAGRSAPEPESDQRCHRIVTVSLPTIATADTSGITMGAVVMSAVLYGLNRARLILDGLGDKTGRVVVNLSYAISGGPHNGNGFFERLLDDLLAHHKQQGDTADYQDVHAVVPAGNTFHDQTHARTQGVGDLAVVLPWRLVPGDTTSNFLEVWYPEGADAEDIEIVPPVGTKVSFGTEADVGSAPLFNNTNGKVIGQVSIDSVPGRKRFLLCLAPTDTARFGQRAAASGVWSVSMMIRGSGAKVVDAWIQRDGAPFGYRNTGKQSYFDHPDYMRRKPVSGALVIADTDGPVRREGTLSGIGTADSVWTVGAYRLGRDERAGDSGAADRKMSDYSAAGAQGMHHPDMALPGDTSKALPGVLGASSRGGAVALSGTSVAAPQLTRLLANRVGGLAPSKTADYRFGSEKRDSSPDLKRNIYRD